MLRSCTPASSVIYVITANTNSLKLSVASEERQRAEKAHHVENAKRLIRRFAMDAIRANLGAARQ